jgi:hypothetical protein
MMTTNYKSQGRTFREVAIDSLELLDRQRESGLMFDEEKLLALRDELRDTASKMDITVVTTPERQVILDNDHVVNPSLIWFDEISQDGDKMYVEWLKRRKLEQVELQQLPKAVVHDEVQFERKHPYMFKITDLVEDPIELARLKMRLESDKQFEKYYGFKMAPIFVEAIPDANIIARSADDTMKKLVKLAAEYKVEIYFGTKTALKTIMYQFMYGARRADMDLSKVEEISVEKAQEMVDKQTKVAILGGHGLGFGKMAKLLADHYSEEIRMVESCDTWNFKDFAAIAKLDKPARDWEQGKLRRGKGHNKFKRKGKK